jgi:hypothetical protein
VLDFLRLFFHVQPAPFRTQAQLEAEITMLRHQLNVLRRQAPSKPKLTAADRLLFVWLCRLFPSPEIRSLIRRMSAENPLWGAPRVHGELQKLGIAVAQSTVGKYMARRRPGSGQTWKTFLRNHAACLCAMDFLVVPTINFRLLSVLVILRHERRRLISLSVTDHPTAEWMRSRSQKPSLGARRLSAFRSWVHLFFNGRKHAH